MYADITPRNWILIFASNQIRSFEAEQDQVPFQGGNM